MALNVCGEREGEGKKVLNSMICGSSMSLFADMEFESFVCELLVE